MYAYKNRYILILKRVGKSRGNVKLYLVKMNDHINI